MCDLVFPGEALVGRRRDYFASLVSSMIVAAMREWENGGRVDTAEAGYTFGTAEGRRAIREATAEHAAELRDAHRDARTADDVAKG